MKSGKEYFELLLKWSEEKQEGVWPSWTGARYKDFKKFFGLKNRDEGCAMLDLIQQYLESPEGKHDHQHTFLDIGERPDGQERWDLFSTK